MRSLRKACCVTSLACVLFIAGCGAGTPPPAVEIRMQRVETPVAVPCLPADKIPAEPERIASSLTGEVSHDLDLTAGVAIRLRDWGQAMHAALVACAS